MFNASDILHQQHSLNKESTINKFKELINTILAQMETEHLDGLISTASKYVSNEEAKASLIDGIIRGRCNALEILPKLSISEQFYILAHMNLDLVTPEVEELNPIFTNLVYSIIRKAVII